MLKHSKRIVALALAVPLMITTAYADEDKDDSGKGETVQMSDLPSAVQKTVRRESKGKTVESIKKDTEAGKTVYEVEIISKGKGQEIEISEAGKVLKRHATHEEKNESDERAPSKP